MRAPKHFRLMITFNFFITLVLAWFAISGQMEGCPYENGIATYCVISFLLMTGMYRE